MQLPPTLLMVPTRPKVLFGQNQINFKTATPPQLREHIAANYNSNEQKILAIFCGVPIDQASNALNLLGFVQRRERNTDMATLRTALTLMDEANKMYGRPTDIQQLVRIFKVPITDTRDYAQKLNERVTSLDGRPMPIRASDFPYEQNDDLANLMKVMLWVKVMGATPDQQRDYRDFVGRSNAIPASVAALPPGSGAQQVQEPPTRRWGGSGSSVSSGRDVTASGQGSVQPPTFPAVLEHPKTVALRQLLQEKFSPEELRELCQSIRVDYEDIGRPKQLELVQYCGRRSMHGQLLTAMYNARPDLRSELQQFASSGSSSSSSAGSGYTQASASRPAPPPSSGSGSTSSTGTAPNIERAMEEVLGWDANAYYMFAKLIGMSSVRPNQSQRNYIDQIRDYSGTKANDRQTVNRIMSAFHVIKALTTAFNSSGIDGLAFDCANQHYDDVRSVHASPTKAVMLAYYIQQKGNKQQFLRTFQSENPHQYTHFALGDPQNTLILDR